MNFSRGRLVTAFALLLVPTFLAFTSLRSDPTIPLQEDLNGNAAISLHDLPSTGEQQILVRMDAVDSDGHLDGIPDRMYRFQTRRAPEDLPTGIVEGVGLSYTSGVLHLRDRVSGSPFLSLVVDGYGEGTGSVTVGGFGLSTVCGADYEFWALGDGTLSPEQLERVAVDCPEEEPLGGCAGGGPGSNECGVEGCEGKPTGCNTACSTGTYACCFCYFDGVNHGACCRCYDAPKQN